MKLFIFSVVMGLIVVITESLDMRWPDFLLIALTVVCCLLLVVVFCALICELFKYEHNSKVPECKFCLWCQYLVF